MRRNLIAHSLASTTLLLALVGCGGSDRAPLGEVSGTVTYRGKPVPEGTLIFEVPGARPASGKIVDGRITEVTTYDPGDGAPVGAAKIAVFATASAASSDASAAPATPDQKSKAGADYMSGGASLIPQKYNNPATSGLTWQIEPGANQIELELSE